MSFPPPIALSTLSSLSLYQKPGMGGGCLLQVCFAMAYGLMSLTGTMMAADSTNSISAPFQARAGGTTSPGSVTPLLNSSNSHFEWGWVSLGSDKYLLGVVYMPANGASTQVDIVTGLGTGGQQVWVANRNRPVNGDAVVELSPDGNLVLRRGDGSVAWATSTQCRGPWLSLKNEGNLKLLDENGVTVWQSFDHPSDTLLPGQVIVTGTQVTASVSFSNVSEGRFSVVMEEGGLIMYAATPAGSLPYHVVGFSPIDKNNTVESVQQPSQCKGTAMTYSSGGGVVTFRQLATGCNNSFSIPVGSNDNNTDTFFRLDSDGNFRTYVYRLHYGWGVDQNVFSGSLSCALPSICGSYGVCSSQGSCSCPMPASGSNLFRLKNPSDSASGCVLSSPPTCLSSQVNVTDNNQFVELAGISYFANDFTYQLAASQNACISMCASSCNCSVAFYQRTTGSCYHYQYMMSMRKVTDTSFVAFMKVGSANSSSNTASSGELPPPNWNEDAGTNFHNKTVMIIIFVSAFIAVLSVASFTLLGMKIRKRLADMHADDAFLESLPGLTTRFSFKELNKATDGFSKKLGIGGFGSVYEGVLGDGSRIAVKRLEGARQGQKEFHAEVAVLGSINHLNLVRLRGFCTQRSQCLLVYDHVIHGSLDAWLFSDCRFLDWPTRYNIALDTARGLAFLHEESRERIVHLDIKPQNILLDENYIAKLSDFGLSKLLDRGESDVVTNMRGTPGYVAPEWLLQAAVTSKSDVYSYGMVLLELVSGRRNLDLSRNTFWYFPAWAVMMVEEGKLMDIVDDRLKDMTWDMGKEAEKIIKVAMWCIQEDPNIRPCMTTVVRILEGHGEVEDAPSLLEFAMRIRSAGKVSSSSSNPHILASDLTISSTHVTNSVLSGPR